MIARKILEIYTGRRTATIGKAERNSPHHERRRGKGDPELPDDRAKLLRALLRTIRLLPPPHEATAAAGGSSGGTGLASPRGKRLPGPCPFQGQGPRTLAVHPVDGLQIRSQPGSLHRRAHERREVDPGRHCLPDRSSRALRRLAHGAGCLQLRGRAGPQGHLPAADQLPRSLLGSLSASFPTKRPVTCRGSWPPCTS